MTDLPDTQKLTLRWLFDHVPVKWWISFAILLVTIATAGFSVGARDSIHAWIAELTLGKLSTENADLRELATTLEVRVSRQNEELLDLKAISEGAKETMARVEEQIERNRTLVEQNQRLSAKVRELEEENTRFTIARDNLQAELNSHKETRRKLAMITDQVASLREQNSQLLSENKRLNRDIDELKRRAEQLNEEHSRFASHGGARDLIAALPNMMATDVAGFLIETIPEIRGGISCLELVQLVSHGLITDTAVVVTRMAPYIQRPFGDTCLSSLSEAMMSTDAADAIRILISSTPAY